MSDIRKGSRVQSHYYGLGEVEEIDHHLGQAFVLFDGDRCRRRVHMAHLLAVPARLPATSAPPLPPIRPRLTVVVPA